MGGGKDHINTTLVVVSHNIKNEDGVCIRYFESVLRIPMTHTSKERRRQQERI